MQRIDQLLGKTTLFLLQITGLLGLVIAFTFKVVVGEKDSTPVLSHQLWHGSRVVGHSVLVHYDLIITVPGATVIIGSHGSCRACVGSAYQCEARKLFSQQERKVKHMPCETL